MMTNKYFIQLDEQNNVVAVIEGQTFAPEGWLVVDSEYPIRVGMVADHPTNPTTFDDSVIVWGEIRAQRDVLLRDTDWTQLPDTLSRGRLTEEEVEAFADYRQALADLPQNFAHPSEVVWPTKPV